ncbi:DUF4381 family protein [Cognatiluteimonas lumbrici]|uniref:DUF4381 family protein n=1 Tax=Cognatiluteimonas lumbrici TaxID=2559601 RepID=UPI00319E4F57
MTGMASDPTLVLRDIHELPPPPWWPPAPSWWFVAGALLLALLALAWRAWRRRQRRRALERLFDASLAEAATPAARIAAMSLLLRRAARQRDPAAASLEGAEWLAFLDRGSRAPMFDDEDARLLLEGGFRRDVDEAAVARLAPRVRARFLDWMAGQWKA